jgi:hypothetical protein
VAALRAAEYNARMDAELKVRAEQRMDQAVAAGARDPRVQYRQRLQALKERDRTAYGRASAYYREELVPAVAGEADPLEEWLEYGRGLAELTAPGRTVQIDPQGLSAPYARPVPADALVLHLPAANLPAIAVGIPPALSPAQRASFDLLVKRAFAGRGAPRTE